VDAVADWVGSEEQDPLQRARIHRLSRPKLAAEVDDGVGVEAPDLVVVARGDRLQDVAVREDQVLLDQEAGSNMRAIQIHATNALDRGAQQLLAWGELVQPDGRRAARAVDFAIADHERRPRAVGLDDRLELPERFDISIQRFVVVSQAAQYGAALPDDRVG